MTTITINEDAHRVMISGHSGYAPAGKDIVCAGISSLAWALAAQLSKAGLLLVVAEQDGNMEIKYTTGADPYLDMFLTGAELIEAKYPEHVSVQGRNPKDDSAMIEQNQEGVRREWRY